MERRIINPWSWQAPFGFVHAHDDRNRGDGGEVTHVAPTTDDSRFSVVGRRQEPLNFTFITKEGDQPMLPYELEYIFSYSAQLHPPEIIGPVAEGIRANFYVASGEVSGPRVQGILRPVGGDWITVRSDGVGILDVRATVETQDDALIYLCYSGVADLGPDGYQSFGRGELPPRFPIQAVMRTQTAHPAYQWLNRLQCLNIGEVDSARLAVSYDVYAVR